MPLEMSVSKAIGLGFVTAALLILVACGESSPADRIQMRSPDAGSIVVGPTRVAAPAPSPTAMTSGQPTSAEYSTQQQTTSATLTGIPLILQASPPGNPTPEVATHIESSASSARVTGVAVSGGPSAYMFVVTVESPDAGCGQYADWWEVVSSDGGTLLYRRVLLHSHTDEQPFTRSGGPVDIGPDDIVAVRAHMSTSGYGSVFMKGSVSEGFETATAEHSFGLELESESPLPTSCAF